MLSRDLLGCFTEEGLRERIIYPKSSIPCWPRLMDSIACGLRALPTGGTTPQKYRPKANSVLEFRT